MKHLIPILLSMAGSIALAQDSLENKLQVKGYVKDLQSLSFQENMTDLVTGNLIHHRLNVKWRPGDKLTAAVELRNRLFWGEEVASVPDFSRQLRNNNEAIELNWNFLDNERMVFNTAIDRLWIEYERRKWNVRVGRQRINWGIGTTWNANDLFNTFNFLDFDYEERPGSDGIKFQYFTGDMDYIETAVSFTQHTNEIVAAVKYFKNIATYDIQFIAGFYQKQATFGIGWSGSIKETGFKGEIQYFFSKYQLADLLNASVEADHVFPKGWYLNVGLFFNSSGVTRSEEMLQVAALQFSPKNLMPTRWNSSLTVSKELSPLVSITTTAVYAPDTNLTILLPGVTFSATENLDINLVWQSFFADQGSSFNDLLHRCFLRLKWSY